MGSFMNKKLKCALSFTIVLFIAGCGPVDDLQHIENATKFLANGDQKSALIELKSAIQQNPQNGKARTLLGQLYLKAGNFAAAEKELKKAQELGEDANGISPYLSKVFLQLRKLDDVIAMQTNHLQPNEQGEVLAAQGIAFLVQGDHNSAVKQIDRAVEIAPGSAYVRVAKASAFMMAEKSLGKAREQLKRAFEIDNKLPAAWSLLGDIEANEKNLELARDAYTKSMSLMPTNLADRNKRVTINILLNDLKKAQYDLDILKKMLPGNAGVAFSQGLVYLASNKLDDAKSAFDLALLDQDRYPLSLFYLAYVNYRLGNIAQAETHAERYFTLNPGYLPNRKLLADIKYSRKEYDYVDELINPVLKANQEDDELINIMAKTKLMRGETAEGIALLNQIVERNPESAEARVRLGAGLLMSGNQEEGFAQLEAAIVQDKNDHQADTLRVLSYLRLKEMEKAHQAAADFQKRAPESEIPYNLMGMIFIAERDLPGAQKALEQSWKIKPGNTDAGHNLAIMAIQDKKYAQARDFLNGVIVAHPDNLETLVKLAELDAIEGKTEQQVQQLEKAIRLYPGAVKPRLMLARHYINSGNPAQVTGLIETLDFEARKQLPVLEVLAIQAIAQKNYKSVEKAALEIIAKKPDGPEGHYFLAQAYAGQDNLNLAEKALLKAIEKDDRYLPARIALLRLLVKKPDIPAVEREVASLKTFTNNNEDVMKVAFALEQLKGDQQQALKLAEEVFAAYPNVDNMLALSRQRLRVGDSAGALSLQEKWAESNAEEYNANFILAESYTRLKKYDLAAKYYQRALAVAPDDIRVLNNLAWVMRTFDPEQALTYIQRANELKPGSVTLMDTLALVYLANKETELALRTIKEVGYLEPNNPTLRYHEAMINAMAGNNKIAVQILTGLLEKEQDFSEKAEAKALFEKLNKG
jgi:putative PEP-CTERM system TPR-repeat lipoprotein